MVTGYIYKVTSPSGKAYIGITSQTVDRRWKKHVSTAFGPDPEGRGCPALARAIQKYGKESFKVQTLLIADWDYLCMMEPKAIVLYGTKAPNGYNLTDGGDGVPGVPRTPKYRKKLSQAMSGRTLSEEHRKAISSGIPWKGKKRPEHAAKMSKTMKQVWSRRSAEQRQAISNKQSKTLKETLAKRRQQRGT